MPRAPTPHVPMLLGFEDTRCALERVARPSSDGYPLYDIERIAATGTSVDLLRITLAVAGFARNELEVVAECGQLVVRGKQVDDKRRVYLHRGIAARQFQRVFLLAPGVQVMRADLASGLLRVDLCRPDPGRQGQVVGIDVRD